MEAYEEALQNACQEGDTERVKALLDYPNINPNIQNKDGFTPLHLGCINGHTEAVKALLTHSNIDFNIQDKYGGTP
jgi:ankyrin repeat protein